MPRPFGRLPFLTRRSARSRGDGDDAPPVATATVDDDTAAVGPPMLLPAMIYREVLFDASEVTPVWARPRPPAQPAPPAPAASSDTTPRGGPPDGPPESQKPPRRTRRSAAAADPPATPNARPAKPRRTRKDRPLAS